jgi:hypothetical protein
MSKSIKSAKSASPVVQISLGYFEGTYLARILRPLTTDDFTFTLCEYGMTYNPKETYGCGYAVGITVKATLNLGILQGLKDAFAIVEDRRPYNRYWEDKLECLFLGVINESVGSTTGFQGCSGHEARAKRAAKFAKEQMPLLRGNIQEFKETFAQKYNTLIESLVKDINSYYSKTHVQGLTRETWPELDKAVGVKAIREQAAELRRQADEMLENINKALNAKALEELEKDKWELSDNGQSHTLTPEVVACVKKAYQENLAFRRHEVRIDE